MDNIKEIISRSKLLMEYDTSKTYDENKILIREFEPFSTTAWVTYIAIGAAATWIYNSWGGGGADKKTKIFFDGCKALSKSLKPTPGVNHGQAADQIYDAVDGAGTNEKKIKSALTSMKTPADLCALQDNYNLKYGDLYDDIDGDIDFGSWKTYVWAPIAQIITDNPLPKEGEQGGTANDRQTNVTNAYCNVKNGVIVNPQSVENGTKWDDYVKKHSVTAAEIETAKKTCPTANTEDKTTTTDGQFPPCKPNEYKQGCSSEKVREVQRCFYNLTKDGKFGPRTQSALAAIGFSNGFTDADVKTICDKAPKAPAKQTKQTKQTTTKKTDQYYDVEDDSENTSVSIDDLP